MLEGIKQLIKSEMLDDLISVIPQEIIIKEIEKDGTIVAKHIASPSELIDTQLGSITGGQFGLFYKPKPGSKALAIRVYPGSTNHTQIIKTISNPSQIRHDHISEPVEDTEQGHLLDGNFDVEPGSVLLRSDINQKLHLNSINKSNGSIELIDNNNSGINIETFNSSSILNIISHYQQSVSNGGRSFSGEYHKGINESYYIKNNSNLYSVKRPDMTTINKIGLFYPGNAYTAMIMNKPRNVPLTFNKKIINHVAEKAKFVGYENEKQVIMSKKNPEESYDLIENGRLIESRKIYNLFFMAPDQLLQTISGNILSDIDGYFSPVNINYGVTPSILKSSKDILKILDNNSLLFDKIKNNNKRGIAYHFQLNTHDNIKDVFYASKNTRFILDKEGVLKANIPKSSIHGNIMYPDSTTFISGNDISPKISSEYSNRSSIERIPITNRNSDGNVQLPSLTFITESPNIKKTRNTGIQFSNSNGYFDSSGTGKLRVNTTKYHNMWAACEMLLANYIVNVSLPRVVNDKLHNIVMLGMSKNETFEKIDSTFSGSLANPSKKEYEIPSYGTVLVSPQKPSINPGGDVIFGGALYRNLQDYSNSEDSTSGYSGVSSNINLEGSLEASIGSDDADGKSVTLDTNGSIVTWIGKDKNNRSLSMQTDGSVLVNIGGHSSDGTFNEGRLDLRVNLTDKGKFDDEELNPRDNIESTDSDFIISISDKGIIISGMKKNIPMLINNSGQIVMQSQSGIILNGGMGGVKVIEKNRPAKDVGLPQSNTANSLDSGDPTNIDSIAQTFRELADLSTE